MSIFSHHSHFSNRRVTSATAGFTLIELLAVAAIITVITAFVVFRQSSFDSSTVLRSLAYGVSLSVRQTQVYGISVLRSAASPNAVPAYGLYFGNSTQNYTLFADINGNSALDVNEVVKVFNLSNGYSVSEVCMHLPPSTFRCNGADDTTGSATITYASIIFQRPNPDAKYASFYSSGVKLAETYDSAYVRISAGSSSRLVKITTTGEINVCPLNDTVSAAYTNC